MNLQTISDIGLVEFREFLVSPAYGRVGTRATIPPLARKKFFGEAQARARREGKGVWGKGIPAPPERSEGRGKKKSSNVDPRGIEPLSSGCKPDALPLSYGPTR